MSYTEDEGEQSEESEQDYDSICQFFFQLTKPLLLELPSPEDRASAAVWIQRLEMDPETEEEKRLRADYLKLLLFVMQRGRLIGIFKDEPPSGPLQPFPDGLGLTEMGNFLLEQAELQGSGDADGRKVSYNVEISNDLREFVAAQEIPDFGIQIYYAWSVEDPIYKWASFDETKVPHHVRDKIRQLKIVKSEEKTNVKTGSLHGEKTDSSLRRSCDSTLYEKNRAKVKSPEEIEKSLERNHHTLTNYLTQRESAKDKASDDDANSSPARKSRNHSPDALSFREKGASKFCCQEFNIEETDDEDVMGDTERGGSSPSYSGNASWHQSGGCPHSRHQRDTDTSKRLQKCDDAVANGSLQMNEHSSYMAGSMPLKMPAAVKLAKRLERHTSSTRSNTDRKSQRVTDKCHGREMYSESPKCGGEATTAPKTPCSAARGIHMSQANLQPSMKIRKSRNAAQGCTNQQEDPNKRHVCPSTMKGPPTQDKNQCYCPCPRAEKEREMPCFKKKDKSQLEKTCPKSKPPCSESMAAKRPQEQPCPIMEEGMKSCARKMQVEPPDGCTCGEDGYKHQLENLSRIGREKGINDMCPQEMAPQQQQYSCARKKRDKKPTEQPEEMVPGSCSKNRPQMAEEMKKRGETLKELCAQQRPQQSANPSYYHQTTKLQDGRGPGRPCSGDYPANDVGPCSRNQDFETKMHGRSPRDVECMDPRKREAEIKEMKHCGRQGQEYPGYDNMPCSGKKMPQGQNYPCYQEPAARPQKMPVNTCFCSTGGQRPNREEEFCDNASSGSDDNPAEEGEAEDECANPNNNPEDECQIYFNPNEEGNADCSFSSENVHAQNYDFCDGTEYKALPQRIRPNFGYNETPNKNLGPGCEPCAAEQSRPQQPGQSPFTNVNNKQKYFDPNCTLPARRKKAPDPRDFPSCNKFESPKQSRYIITSTPAADAEFQPFAQSPISTIPPCQRTRYGQWESEDELIPINKVNKGGTTYSIHKENVPSRRKKTSQDISCSRGSPSQIQYKTIQDEDCNESPDMPRAMHCGGGSYDINISPQSQKWVEPHIRSTNCPYRRDI